MIQKVNLRVPTQQMLKLLGFADEMLTMLEESYQDLSLEEQVTAKELRHILNKVVKLTKDQIDDSN
jgi:predicted RNA-binding protein with EMAP domain